MQKVFDGLLSPWAFLALNVIILALTEWSGETFMDNGIIHVIALIFVMLALTRIFVPALIADKTVRRFVIAALIALILFALSHIVEFVSFVINAQYADAAFINVANFYMVSLCSIIIGVELILRSYYARPSGLLIAASVMIAFFGSLCAWFLIFPESASLEPTSLTPYLYIIGVLAVTGFAFVNLLETARIQEELSSFCHYLSVAVGLIALSALVNVLYEVLKDAAGLPDFQSVYLAHFAFYASLSVLFLSFGKPLLSHTLAHEDSAS